MTDVVGCRVRQLEPSDEVVAKAASPGLIHIVVVNAAILKSSNGDVQHLIERDALWRRLVSVMDLFKLGLSQLTQFSLMILEPLESFHNVF